jgi:hypothetical protein
MESDFNHIILLENDDRKWCQSSLFPFFPRCHPDRKIGPSPFFRTVPIFPKRKFSSFWPIADKAEQAAKIGPSPFFSPPLEGGGEVEGGKDAFGLRFFLAAAPTSRIP